ncbi:serine/threonine-protein kinase [Actinomadura rudentiformis]|uniref:non-specific serine/threonine protein kinase n=1 Tax=Actinomadura rudentiformis TaxID=359158 RepID=A0A6H9YZS4_9ACTN|nr:serine/threonine-protein kinase [Actinomadura rudentiformis]KAB2352350.1 serine/threonine protein kinase [Actinomadura rudentiformis]
MGRDRRGGEAPGLLADRYRLIEVLGGGGMAEVWRAEDAFLGRPVAIKLLRPDAPAIHAIAAAQAQPAHSPAGPAAVGQAWREAQGAARLVHPNVVQIYDVDTADGQPFLVMELVDGHDLAAVLHQRGPLPPAEVAAIGAQAARALAAAHAAGLVHRDVKPGNLLYAPDGTVKLTDFGIASPLDGSVPGDRTAARTPGPLVGTAAYVSPEQVNGHPATPASDLYALGCVLYELLTGQPPFTADATPALLHHHQATAPTAPSHPRDVTPAHLQDIILQLLAKDPSQRLQDATLVASVLEALGQPAANPTASSQPHQVTQVLPTLDPYGTGSRPASTQAVSAWITHHPRHVAALAGMALLLTVVILVVAFRGSGPTPTPPTAGVPTAAETTQAASPKPVRSRTPSTSPRATASSPLAALAALQGRINQQVASGQLHPEAAGKINDHIKHIAKKLSQGKTEEVAGKSAEIRQKLAEAAGKGQWTPDPTTLQLLDRIAATGR